jgi:type IV pilus assembly protein PilQ
LLLLLLFGLHSVKAQEADTANLPSVPARLDSLAQEVEALNKRIDISVPEAPIQEFLRAVANLSGLNINVPPNLQIQVVNNFTNVRVADLLSFLCQQYNLDLRIMGNIIDIYQVRKTIPPAEPKVVFQKDSALLSIDVTGIPLSRVCRAITTQTGVNILPAPEIYNQPVTLFLYRQHLPDALKNLAHANNLKLEERDDGVFFLQGLQQDLQAQQVKQQGSVRREVNYESHRPSRNSSRIQ